MSEKEELNKRIRILAIFLMYCLAFAGVGGYILLNVQCRLIIKNHTVIRVKEGIYQETDKIQTIEIPEGVTGIGDQAFQGMSSLERAVIPDSVNRIGANAFAECGYLKRVELPEGLLSIGDKAFLRCSDLRLAEIPNSVTVMGEGVFDGCVSLSEIRIPEHLKGTFTYDGKARVIYY